MLHRCSECLDLYVTSRYLHTCNICGGEQRERLELEEMDKVVEYATLAAWAMHGVEDQKRRRWWIK